MENGVYPCRALVLFNESSHPCCKDGNKDEVRKKRDAMLFISLKNPSKGLEPSCGDLPVACAPLV